MADLISFLSGDTGPLERGIEASMQEASRALEFERARVLRDKLEAVRAADAVRQMDLSSREDLDVFGLAEDELEAAVQVFHVRSGKVVGRLGLFVDKVEDLTAGHLIERVLVDVYADSAAGVPRQVLVPTMPEDADAVVAYLSERRSGPVVLRVPLRGSNGRCSRRWNRMPRSPSSAIGCTGPRTTTAGPGRSSRCSTSSACPRRPCASSATT